MIERLKLNKIGGLKSFFKQSLLKLGIIAVVATVAGTLAGHAVQQSFRNLTGFNKAETTEIGTKKTEILPTDNRYDKNKNLAVGIITDTLNMASNGLNTITNSIPMQAANDAAWNFLSTTLSPLFKVLDWAAFWFTFTLAFMIFAWLSNKLIILKSQALNGGIDPKLIKNMELLEAKVNELVDRANKELQVPHT